MRDYRTALVLSVMMFFLAGASAIASAQTNKAQVSADEQAIWHLEHSYWDYVQDNNLTAYRNLWHENFLGWPAVSAAPVGKDHITDWITSQTAKGMAFKSIEFKPARIQVTGDIAVAGYWITSKWQDKDGKGDAHTLRITHTWVREGKDKDWRIIGGMSMPEPAPAQH
jgi:uncharacterized protein (TIGR02246 family)